MEPEHEISEIAIPNGNPMAFARRQLDLAFRFTVTPLVVAFICCAGWWWWRYEAFAVVGAFDLLAGFVALFVSLGLLSQARKSARISGRAVDDAFGEKMNLTWLLACASLPAAVLCMVFALFFRGPVLHFRNESGQPVKMLRVSGDKYPVTFNLGDLAPGQHRRLTERRWSDDENLMLRFSLGGQEVVREIATSGGSVEVPIQPGGSIEGSVP